MTASPSGGLNPDRDIYHIGDLPLGRVATALGTIVFQIGGVAFGLSVAPPANGGTEPTPPLPSGATLNKYAHGYLPPSEVFKLYELLEFAVLLPQATSKSRGAPNLVATYTLRPKLHCE